MNSLERSENVFLGRRKTRLHHGAKRDSTRFLVHDSVLCILEKQPVGLCEDQGYRWSTDLLAMGKMKTEISVITQYMPLQVQKCSVHRSSTGKGLRLSTSLEYRMLFPLLSSDREAITNSCIFTN